MKKLTIVLILLLFLLSGCGMYIGEEKSKEYRDLSKQYDAYVDKDISEDELFYELINRAMIEVIPSIVKVEVFVYSNVNILIETRTSTGIIFEQFNEAYFILIDQKQTEITTGQKIEYRVTDYLDNTYNSQHLYNDDIYPITVIFMTSKNPLLKKINVSSYIPKIGEPVLLLGNHFNIQNATSMGLVTSYRADLKQINTSIPSDTFSHGGAVINNQLELIGIQTTINDNNSVFITIDAIKEVMSKYNKS